MGVNAQFEHAQSRSLSHRLPLWLVIALCVGIDIAAVWYVAQMWERVVPYLPWLLLGIAVISFAARIRSALRKDE